MWSFKKTTLSQSGILTASAKLITIIDTATCKGCRASLRKQPLIFPYTERSNNFFFFFNITYYFETSKYIYIILYKSWKKNLIIDQNFFYIINSSMLNDTNSNRTNHYYFFNFQNRVLFKKIYNYRNSTWTIESPC